MASLTDMIAEAEGGTGKALIERTYWGFILPGADLSDAAGPALRAVGAFFGVSMIFASIGLWVLPGSTFGGDALLLKLALSAFFLLFGAMILQFGQDAGKPEVQVDLHRKEIRVVSRGRDGVCKLESLCSFDEIGEVDVNDGCFRVFGRDREELAALALANAGERLLR